MKKARSMTTVFGGSYILVRNKTIWIMEDRFNGDMAKGSYLWIFNTRKEALDHRREQHKLKHASRLSMPQKVKLRGQYERKKVTSKKR
jgi:hypothetical protein